MPFRSNQLIAAVVFSCVFIWFTFSVLGGRGRLSEKAPQIEEHPVEEVPPVGDLLDHHGIFNLTDSGVQFSQIHITVSQSDVPSYSLLQSLDLGIPASTEIRPNNNGTDPRANYIHPATTILQIPRQPPNPPDVSDFVFGVATTYDRLYHSLDTFSHWLSNTNTRLVAAMEPSLDEGFPDEVLQKARALNIPLGTFDSGYQFLDRYFSLLKVMHQHSPSNTKWYVIIDDDTFFMDLANVVLTINTKYNASLPYYVGALTEDFQQMANWGYMAYGGGGVFLSAPLLEELLPYWDECYSHRNTGDRMLAACIYQHTTTKFTWEHNLHQLDLHGDQSGFYEALRPQPLSVHHWKGGQFGFQNDMKNLSLVSSICGNTCLLQKFKLNDNWILTNGYSLVKYSDTDMQDRDIGTDVSMERTWDFFWGGANDIHFEHTLGPLRKPDESGKISFRMESALRDRDGNVRQLYLKRKKGKELGAVEGAVEIVWSSA